MGQDKMETAGVAAGTQERRSQWETTQGCALSAVFIVYKFDVWFCIMQYRVIHTN